MIWGALLVGAVLVFVLQRFLPERSLDSLEADRAPESLLVEPEEPADLVFSIQNKSRRFFPYAAIENKLPFTREEAVRFTFWMAPRQTLTRHFPVTIDRRGRYVVEELKLKTGDFLGLKEHNKVCGSYQEIVVPPKAQAFSGMDVLMGGFLGDVSANRFILEDPVLTLGFREYTGTDPMKRISWVQSARQNRLMVKKNDFTVEPSVSVLLNVQTDLEENSEAFENCFRLTRAVCAALEKKGMRYSFAGNARLLGYNRSATGIAGFGQRHFHAILENLGRSETIPATPLAVLLEQELQRPECSGRIVITPGGNEVSQIRRLQEFGPLLVFKGTEVAPWE